MTKDEQIQNLKNLVMRREIEIAEKTGVLERIVQFESVEDHAGTAHAVIKLARAVLANYPKGEKDV